MESLRSRLADRTSMDRRDPDNYSRIQRSDRYLISYLRERGITTEDDLNRLNEDLYHVGLTANSDYLKQAIAYRWSMFQNAEYEGYRYIAPLAAIITPSGREIIDLSPTEFGIVGILIFAKGQLVKRQSMVDRLMLTSKADPSERGQRSRALDTHFSRMRKEVGPPDNKVFANVRGEGYILDINLLSQVA